MKYDTTTIIRRASELKAKLYAGWHPARCAAFEQLKRLFTKTDECEIYSKNVHDILAILHCDGGHYTDEHGLEKSIVTGLRNLSELKFKANQWDKSDKVIAPLKAKAEALDWAIKNVAHFRVIITHNDTPEQIISAIQRRLKENE